MSLKSKQVVEAHRALETLIALDRQGKLTLDSATRLKLAGNRRVLNPAFSEFEEERIDLVKKLGESAKDKPTTIVVKPENQAEFDKQMAAMNEVNTSVLLSPISIEDLFGPADKQNQIDIDFIVILQDIGLVEK